MEKVIFLFTVKTVNILNSMQIHNVCNPPNPPIFLIIMQMFWQSTNQIMCQFLSSDVTGQLSVASWFGHLHLRGDGLNSGLFRPWNFPIFCHSGAVTAKKCIKCIVSNVIVSSGKVSTLCCDSNSTGTLLLAQCLLLQWP